MASVKQRTVLSGWEMLDALIARRAVAAVRLMRPRTTRSRTRKATINASAKLTALLSYRPTSYQRNPRKKLGARITAAMDQGHLQPQVHPATSDVSTPPALRKAARPVIRLRRVRERLHHEIFISIIISPSLSALDRFSFYPFFTTHSLYLPFSRLALWKPLPAGLGTLSVHSPFPFSQTHLS
ncbi:hypothetical protein ACJQWK_06386 [Exserohilum turcicum]